MSFRELMYGMKIKLYNPDNQINQLISVYCIKPFTNVINSILNG